VSDRIAGRAGQRAVRTGRSLSPGSGEGPAVRLSVPLSFWGGVDQDGVVIDAHHPQRGTPLAGRVLLMASGRGSSSSSSVLAELIRAGVAPAAIVLAEADAIIAIGAIVAAELYGLRLPVLVLDDEVHAQLPGCTLTVEAGAEDGAISWDAAAEWG
jgi:uncharacterized protein